MRPVHKARKLIAILFDRAFRFTSCTFTSGTQHSQLMFLLFCDKPLAFQIWIITITVWKRGHIYKHLEMRSRNYITALFSGNEKEARPSEIVTDHATKVAWKFIREKKRKMRKARNKRKRLPRAANESEAGQMRRQNLRDVFFCFGIGAC